jgi:hypothetical protein
MGPREELDMWIKVWDDACAKEAAASGNKPKPAPKNQSSYFGMTYADEDAIDGKVQDEDIVDWRDIHRRAAELIDDRPMPPSGDIQVFTEEETPEYVKYPFEPRGKFGAGRSQAMQHNPTVNNTGGPDGSPSPMEPTRVTPNFINGPQLEELAVTIDKLHKLKSKLSEAILHGNERSRKRLDNEVKKLAHHADALSDLLVPPELEDLA